MAAPRRYGTTDPGRGVVAGSDARPVGTVPRVGWLSRGAGAPCGPIRIGLVGCVKQKRPGPAPAADLYTSALFRGRRRWVEQTCGRWYILSAKYGLVRPETFLYPYDQTLTGAGVEIRRRWSNAVLDQLRYELGDLRGMIFEIHAGADYREYGLIDGLHRFGAYVEVPAAGLGQGQQLRLYKQGPSAFVGRPVDSSDSRGERVTSERGWRRDRRR